MAWPFSGSWDGKSLDDLPEIIAALCNAINERRAFLGASLIAFPITTGTSTAPLATDFDGMSNAARDSVLKKIGEECWINNTGWLDPNDTSGWPLFPYLNLDNLTKANALNYVGLLPSINGGPQYATHLDWYLTAKGLLDLQYMSYVSFTIDGDPNSLTVCQYCNSGCTTNNPNTVSVSTEEFYCSVGNSTTEGATILESRFFSDPDGIVKPGGTVTLTFGPETFSTYNGNGFDISFSSGFDNDFDGPTTAATTNYDCEFTFDSAPTAAYSNFAFTVRLVGKIDFYSELTYIS